MAEVALAASVIQIASVGVKLSTTLYAFAETVSAAEKTLKHIADDVSLTSAVLKQLGRNLEWDNQRGIASHNAIKTAEEVMHECLEVFNDIEATLEKAVKKAESGKYGMGKAAFAKLRWPLLQPKMELLRSNLERHKTTLILMLNVLTYAAKLKQYEIARFCGDT